MSGSLPGKEKQEKGGQGTQTNKMDSAGEVLPLFSCSCIQPRQVSGTSSLVPPAEEGMGSPKKALQPSFHLLSSTVSVFSTGVRQTGHLQHQLWHFSAGAEESLAEVGPQPGHSKSAALALQLQLIPGTLQ